MKISKLPSEIFNRIAAGEVVENPASIVKEIAENAIDAGATEISITIKGGGIDYICVEDNGCGIEYDDIPTAFLPHATSKIKSLGDLDNIATLGFRGEALPSIAAVADVTLLSRVHDSDLGGRIVYKDGKLISREQCGAKLGTTVSVENLFERIPARKKFLSKPSYEETRIRTLVEHLVLANPNIIFKFNSETKQFSSSGEGIQSAIYAVFGENTLKNTVQVQAESEPISVTGYTCIPSYTKPSKNYQHIIINGRYVESADISYAVYSIYAPYLMKRQYPLYVLYMTIPFDMVDVNVHPSKMQVKFADTVKVKSIVATAIKNAINPRLTAPKPMLEETAHSMPQDFKEYGKAHILPSFFAVQPNSSGKVITQTLEVDTDYNAEITATVDSECSDIQTVPGVNYADLYKSSEDFSNVSNFAPTECRYVGKLFNTYIILERDNFCYFIDQHAAHEKILYDKLLADYESKRLTTQPLMLPFVFDVSPSDAEKINENLDLFEECGFGITPFGDYTFTLSYIPYECSGIDFKAFISDLLLLIKSREKSPTVLKERLMQSACKAAVKGEIDDLSQSEIEALLAEMASKNITMFCPHGRPIAVAFEKKEIEKWFKRIV